MQFKRGWQTLKAQTTGLFAVSSIAWLDVFIRRV
jgi:hypothetical protein